MFIVEGNIGAGKTTLLKKIKKELPFLNVIFEPVNQWHSGKSGQSLLTDFYKDPKRWAYTLETFAMVCRVKEYLKESSSTDIKALMERSIFSGHYCFAKNDYINGFMNELEWAVYEQWFSFLVNQNTKLPNGFIYLKTEPEVALERTKKRNRSGEEKISLEYLKDLNNRHEEFLIKKSEIKEELKNIPVLTLDCNYDFEANKNNLVTNLNEINNFITKNSQDI